MLELVSGWGDSIAGCELGASVSSSRGVGGVAADSDSEDSWAGDSETRGSNVGVGSGDNSEDKIGEASGDGIGEISAGRGASGDGVATGSACRWSASLSSQFPITVFHSPLSIK